MITTVQTAAKVHKCNACRKNIEVLEPYVKETLLPWERVEIDVDDEGKPIAGAVGEFIHMRYHNTCYDSMMRG